MAVNIAVFGAFVLIVAILGFFLWQTLFVSKEYSQGQEKSEPSYSEQQPSNENALRGSATPSHNNSTDEAIAEYTKWLAIFTLFLVLATIGLFISGERNVEVARISADAAGRSANAAKAAIELSDRTAERQLRAYVTIIGGQIILTNNLTGGLNISIQIVLKNSGQTPGYKFTTWIKEPQILDPNALPFDEPRPIDERTGMSVIGPGGDVNINWTLPSTPEIRTAIQNGEKNIFVWGGADYTDIFGKERYFHFRDINSVGSRFGVAGDRLLLRPHKAGYDAN